MASLLGAEGILRLGHRRPLFDLLTLSNIPGRIYEHRANVRIGADFLVADMDARGRTVGYHPVPGYYAINNLGFRDAKMSWGDLDGGVLCLGDSTTYGLGVPLEFTYPKQLEDRLRRSLKNGEIRVLNAGVWGYNLEQLEANTRWLLSRSRPRAVVVGLFMNDNQPLPPVARALFWLKEHSRLVHEICQAHRAWNDRARDLSEEGLTARLNKLTDPDTAGALRGNLRTFGGRRDRAAWDAADLWDEKKWDRALTHLDHIADICREKDALLCVLVFPVRDQLFPGFADLRPQQWILTRCANRRVLCLDLTPAFRTAFQAGRPVYTYANDNSHFGVLGHTLAAETLEPTIRRFLKNRPPDRGTGGSTNSSSPTATTHERLRAANVGSGASISKR